MQLQQYSICLSLSIRPADKAAFDFCIVMDAFEAKIKGTVSINSKAHYRCPPLSI
jgi:hypothetical protein